jgi:hypothetical protein
VTTSSKRRSALFRFLDKFLLQDFILPTNRFIGLVIVGAVVTLIASIFDVALPIFWSWNALLCVLSGVDLLLLPKRSSWGIRRKLPEQMDVRSSFEVGLELESEEQWSVHVELMDHLPQTFSMVRNHMSGAFRGPQPLSFIQRWLSKEGNTSSNTYTYATSEAWGFGRSKCG